MLFLIEIEIYCITCCLNLLNYSVFPSLFNFFITFLGQINVALWASFLLFFFWSFFFLLSLIPFALHPILSFFTFHFYFLFFIFRFLFFILYFLFLISHLSQLPIILVILSKYSFSSKFIFSFLFSCNHEDLSRQRCQTNSCRWGGGNWIS